MLFRSPQPEMPKSNWKQIILRIISPPVVGCVTGVIIGLSTPVKNAFFSTWGEQVFIKTLSNVGAITVPLANMLLGCKLASGFTFTKDMNLRIIDLIAGIFIRLVIMPLIGLGYMKLIFLTGIRQIKDNKVLAFVMYTYWFVPPSVLFISLFVMLKHYMKEMALLQFWTNVLTIGTVPAFIIAYFAIFPAEL